MGAGVGGVETLSQFIEIRLGWQSISSVARTSRMAGILPPDRTLGDSRLEQHVKRAAT